MILCEPFVILKPKLSYSSLVWVWIFLAGGIVSTGKIVTEDDCDPT